MAAVHQWVCVAHVECAGRSGLLRPCCGTGCTEGRGETGQQREPQVLSANATLTGFAGVDAKISCLLWPVVK